MSCSFVINLSHRLLYPIEFRIPADSDYDDQEDFELVDTPLMLLELQDMKLRLDYTHLPLLMCVPLYFCLLMA